MPLVKLLHTLIYLDTFTPRPDMVCVMFTLNTKRWCRWVSADADAEDKIRVSALFCAKWKRTGRSKVTRLLSGWRIGGAKESSVCPRPVQAFVYSLCSLVGYLPYVGHSKSAPIGPIVRVRLFPLDTPESKGDDTLVTTWLQPWWKQPPAARLRKKQMFSLAGEK